MIEYAAKILWRMLVRYNVGEELMRDIQSFYRASQTCTG